VVLGVAGVVTLAVVVSGLVLGGYAATAGHRRSTKLILLTAAAAFTALFVALLFLAPERQVGSGSTGWGCFHGRSYYEKRHWDFQKLCGGGHQAGGSATPGGVGGDNGVAKLAALAGGGLIVLLVVAGALAVVLRRHQGTEGEPEATRDHNVLEALDESLDDLRRERDVRRAIIACYARMERALERSGAARRMQETPFEYLARVLGRVAGASLAMRALTELFERAEFSVEPLGLAEKERAIAALEQLRVQVFR
jgi:hypothetical protein